MPLWKKHAPRGGEPCFADAAQVSGVPPPYGLSNRSIQALEIRLGELRSFASTRKFINRLVIVWTFRHAGLDPASSGILDSDLQQND
jgi:hypothetical protein